MPQGRVPGFSCGNSGKPQENLPSFTLTLANDKLDTQLLYFIILLLQSSTCFEQLRAHHQEVKLY